ncbi:MAG: hypothetical protein ACRCTJ_01390, partial [Brevinema sp.]
DLMVPYLKMIDSDMYPSVREKLQKEKVHNGMNYFELWKNNEMTENEYERVAYSKSLEHVNLNPTMYEHLEENGKEVFDIGPDDSGHSSNDRSLYNKAIIYFENAGLISKNSKKFNEGTSKEKSYHIVIN